MGIGVPGKETPLGKLVWALCVHHAQIAHAESIGFKGDFRQWEHLLRAKGVRIKCNLLAGYTRFEEPHFALLAIEDGHDIHVS
jgi:hypothetical protein